jgi:hypothetical protein
MQPQAANSAPISFQADTVDNYSGVWGSMDSTIPCPQYSRGQSQSSASADDHSSPYSYTNDMCSSPVASDSFSNPQYPASGMPVEMVTAIDQYLRSILKPEAFSSPHQQMNPAIWGSDIDIDPTLTDPTFTKIESPVSGTTETITGKRRSANDFLGPTTALFMASNSPFPIRGSSSADEPPIR